MTVEKGLAAQVRNIERRYGRSIDDWAAILKEQGIEKPGQAIVYLKSDHGLDHAAAHRIALVARARSSAAVLDAGADPDPISVLYPAARAALKPIHHRVVAYLQTLGPFEVAPKKGYVSLRRSKQFAMLQPGARWVNLGLVLAGVQAVGRLEDAASFNALFTHRVRITSPEEIDEELQSWLRQAYDGAGNKPHATTGQ